MSSHPLPQVCAMGFPENRARRALGPGAARNAEEAANWCLEHAEDPGVDGPVALVPASEEDKTKATLSI